MENLIEIAGWAAALALLVAYGLLSAGRLYGTSPAYQWMNIAGSAGLLINSGWNGAIPSAAINAVWIGIGAYALWRSAQRRPPTTDPGA